MENKLLETCKMCNHFVDIRDIEEHHVHPGYMGNTLKTGKVVSLCKKCHGKLHWLIYKRNWENMEDEDKEKRIDDIIKFTNQMIQ